MITTVMMIKYNADHVDSDDDDDDDDGDDNY